jgi:hypothetical protein
MTNQRLPDQRRRDNIPAEDGSWSILPIVVAVGLLATIGYFLLSAGSTTKPDRSVSEQQTAPSRTVVPPSPKPAPGLPSTPANPQ